MLIAASWHAVVLRFLRVLRDRHAALRADVFQADHPIRVASQKEHADRALPISVREGREKRDRSSLAGLAPVAAAPDCSLLSSKVELMIRRNDINVIRPHLHRLGHLRHRHRSFFAVARSRAGSRVRAKGASRRRKPGRSPGSCRRKTAATAITPPADAPRPTTATGSSRSQRFFAPLHSLSLASTVADGSRSAEGERGSKGAEGPPRWLSSECVLVFEDMG